MEGRGPPSLRDSGSDRQTVAEMKGRGEEGGGEEDEEVGVGEGEGLAPSTATKTQPRQREFSCQPVMEFLCFPEQ